MPSSDYVFAGGWNVHEKVAISGGRKNQRPPWDETFAESVFDGKVKIVKNSAPLVVLKGSLDAPVAVATFLAVGHMVEVEFLDDQFRPVLKFVFSDRRLRPDDMFLHDDGLQRPGDLLLRTVSKLRWTGDYGPAGVERRIVDSREFSNLGTTRFLPHPVPGVERGPETRWKQDPEVDVSGDGFWEPVATFGDWDRWFVRDRPGVKLVD